MARFPGAIPGAAIIALLLCLFFGGATDALAHRSAPSFMNELATVPANLCPVKAGVRDPFVEKVREVKEGLDEEIRERKQVVKEATNRNSKKAQEAVMDTPGFQGKTGDQMKGMSRAEKKAMADKMMTEKYGVSLDEMKKVKGMTKEGQKNWGRAFVDEQKAGDEVDPAKAAKTASANRGTAKLAQEQDNVTQKVAAVLGKAEKKFREIDEDPLAISDLQKIKVAEGKLAEAGERPCEERRGMAQRIHSDKDRYCTSLGARYKEALDALRVATTQSIPDLDRLDKISAEIQKVQFGIEPTPEALGLSALAAVRSYATKLGDAYKYDLTEGPFDGTSFCSGAQ